MKKNSLNINKAYFKLGLTPIELLVFSQIAEFAEIGHSCPLGDQEMAEYFNVSTKTISRSLKVLENKGFIKRETINIKNGKERYITMNKEIIEKTLTADPIIAF